MRARWLTKLVLVVAVAGGSAVIAPTAADAVVHPDIVRSCTLTVNTLKSGSAAYAQAYTKCTSSVREISVSGYLYKCTDASCSAYSGFVNGTFQACANASQCVAPFTFYAAGPGYYQAQLYGLIGINSGEGLSTSPGPCPSNHDSPPTYDCHFVASQIVYQSA